MTDAKADADEATNEVDSLPNFSNKDKREVELAIP